MPKQTRFHAREPIVPERFKEARLARGMTTQELAEKIDVSRQSISKYELGISEPQSSTINIISECLDVPISFFRKPLSVPLTRSTTFYRSLKTNAARAKDVMSVLSDWASQIASLITESIIFPDVDMPLLPVQFETQESYSYDDIEQITQSVRDAWKLGGSPLPNLAHTLESHGIVIATIKTGFTETDACSSIVNGRPFIFLDIQKECAVRTRFNLAHELGHLILHNNIQQSDLEDKKLLDRIEREANQFASCFLLPCDPFLLDVHSTSLQAFMPLKKKWKVSIQAMVYRCKELGIFSENQMIYIQKQISAKRWRKSEPFDNEWPCEKPVILSKSVQMLIERGDYTKDQFLDEFRLSPADVEGICNLPHGFFSSALTNDAVVIDFSTKQIINNK